MYFCIMINHTAKRVNFHIDILLSFLDISWQTQDVLKFFTYFTLISFKIFQILVRKDRINSCTSSPQNTIYQDSLYSTQISIYHIARTFKILYLYLQIVLFCSKNATNKNHYSKTNISYSKNATNKNRYSNFKLNFVFEIKIFRQERYL